MDDVADVVGGVDDDDDDDDVVAAAAGGGEDCRGDGTKLVMTEQLALCVELMKMVKKGGDVSVMYYLYNKWQQWDRYQSIAFFQPFIPQGHTLVTENVWSPPLHLSMMEELREK